MTTFELIKQLANKPEKEIEYSLFALMITGKINFLSVQQAYIEYLERLKDTNLRQQIEAETCVMESLIYDKVQTKDEQAEVSLQRRLYLLNQSRRFQMHNLNKKFGYDEERAKSYSILNR